MQKLYYASGWVLLGDTVCTAVVEYAQALFPTDDLLVETLTQIPRSVRLF